MCADSWVQADPVDYVSGVEPLHLGIGVQLVEIAYPESQIGVGEELYGFGLCRLHEEHRNILFDRPLLDQTGENLGGLVQFRIGMVIPHDDSGRVEIVVEGLRLAEKLRGEDNIRKNLLHGAVGLALAIGELLSDRFGITNRHRGLYDHDGFRVDLKHEVNDLLDMACVEEIFLRIIVRRGRDNHEIRVRIGLAPVQGGRKIERLLLQILFYVLVLNRRDFIVDFLDLVRDDIHGGHVIAL